MSPKLALTNGHAAIALQLSHGTSSRIPPKGSRGGMRGRQDARRAHEASVARYRRPSGARWLASDSASAHTALRPRRIEAAKFFRSSGRPDRVGRALDGDQTAARRQMGMLEAFWAIQRHAATLTRFIGPSSDDLRPPNWRSGTLQMAQAGCYSPVPRSSGRRRPSSRI
jgi:hypothetical protein